ncbi:cytidine deaminase [Paucihalobacter ruber]|uniref:Cytidine deaminase n=1 Tax=Paucihalobacter ruber TaxID=2567861 RepID=A0A506PK81_9FLAO|nr:cytidine deaminase [Paucihalobacter ruber]TPV34223.1 cytidine deaminase [Paucihalobacter ruber]
MREIQINTVLHVYTGLDELPNKVAQLFEKAREARGKAYAPYSNFTVGAAILLDNGEIITGSNQENASFPSGLCAERTAIYYAGAQFPSNLIKAMAIVAGSKNHKTTTPIPPCGACRQAIAEYEIKQNQPIEIYFMGEEGEIVKSNSLKNLLPLVFDKNVL